MNIYQSKHINTVSNPLNILELKTCDTEIQHQQNPIIYMNKSRNELIDICKEYNIKKYSGKNKADIIKLITLNKHNAIEHTIENISDAVININNTNNINNNTNNTTSNITSSNTSNTNESHPNNDKLNIHTSRLKMADLFAGTGAFSLAFQDSNKTDIVFANDMLEYSKTIYDANFNHKLMLQDLHDINPHDIPKHDILTGGFPCQPFSIAGLQEGFNDKRSNVFWKILSIIEHHQPQFVILENVKNLVSHDSNKTFAIIKSNLESKGYHICAKVLNTADITGIPHHRERTYIVCIKSKDIYDKFNLDFPKIEKQKVSDFLEKDVAPKYYYTDKSSTWNLLKEAVITPLHI